MKDLVTSLRESTSRPKGREVEATLTFGPGYTPDPEDELSEKNGVYVAYACEDGVIMICVSKKNNACAGYLHRDVNRWELLRGPK